MSYRTRTIVALIVVELLLAAGWYWLRTRTNVEYSTPEGPARIDKVFGMAMGGLLGLSPLLYLMARNNDRKRGR